MLTILVKGANLGKSKCFVLCKDAIAMQAIETLSLRIEMLFNRFGGISKLCNPRIVFQVGWPLDPSRLFVDLLTPSPDWAAGLFTLRSVENNHIYIIQGVFYCSAQKLNKKKKWKYPNCSANCSPTKTLTYVSTRKNKVLGTVQQQQWSSGWTNLLQMIIWVDRLLANDRPDETASSKWSSGTVLIFP